MKYAVAAAFGLILLGCVKSLPDQRDELQHIVRMNTLARGGSEAIEAVHALRLEVRIQEPSFVLTGTYVATRTGYVRVDVYAHRQHHTGMNAVVVALLDELPHHLVQRALHQRRPVIVGTYELNEIVKVGSGELRRDTFEPGDETHDSAPAFLTLSA